MTKPTEILAPVISKIDLSKEDKSYYHAGLYPQIVDLDSYYFLTLSGKCAPEDPQFLIAIETIYAVAYKIKFLCKGEDNDFVVPKMECQWFIEGPMDVQHQFPSTPRSEWCWKIHFRMPDFVDQDHFDRAIFEAKSRKPEHATKFEKIQFELINEGRCAQIMHLGSWEEEAPTLEKLFGHISDEGLSVKGYHKEIYISDPQRVEEAKKRTLLRYQVG